MITIELWGRKMQARTVCFFFLAWVLACLSCMTFLAGPAFALEPAATKHVLVLYSFRTILPAQIQVDQGLRSALKAQGRHRVDIDIEYLDLGRYEDAGYLDELLRLFRRKYARRPLDVIVPVFDGAIQFMLKYGQEIFPGVPMVFTAQLEPFLKNQEITPQMTGVYARPELVANLELALRLQPQTRQVVVVGGVSGLDRIFLSWVRDAFGPFASRLAIDYWTDLTVEELRQRVAILPPDTIIYYVSMFRDGKGQELLPLDALLAMAESTSAPIYGSWETLLEGGLVGGFLITHEEQGRLAGELVVRILDGEKPAQIPLVLVDSPPIFNWRQLKRWGISEDKLPPGSMVRYRELSLWEAYRRWIIVFVALVGLQSAFIGALLVNRGRRRRAEQGLAERLRFEEALSGLSAALVSPRSKAVDLEIETALSRMLTQLKIDRISVLELAKDAEQLHTLHIATAPAVHASPGVIPFTALPWFVEAVSQRKTLMLSKVADELPIEAAREREFCLEQGIQSIFAVPLKVGDAVLGVINFVTLREQVDWSRYPLKRLKLVAEIFANALMRGRAERELQEAEQDLRIVADFTYDWEYWQAPDGSLRYVSPACERTTGHSADEFLARPQLLREIILPEDLKVWEGHHSDDRGNLDFHQIEFRIARPDGEIRCIDHVCQPVHGSRGEFLGFRASNRDITQRKLSELREQQHRDQLAHVMRVATLGELTASLAHEFNQPLNAVLNNAQAALRFLDRDQPDLVEVEAALQDIARDGKRASSVIQRLRGFLKPGVMHPEALDINEVAREAAALVHNELLSQHIAMHFSLAPGLPPVRGDRIQLQQVLLNLFLNAMEALRQAGTEVPEIHLKTEQNEAGLITVSVEDNGKGLRPEELEAIFEPFFTTAKEGLGLGLSISRSIITAHGGSLWARANSRQGAAFLFTLPLY